MYFNIFRLQNPPEFHELHPYIQATTE